MNKGTVFELKPINNRFSNLISKFGNLWIAVEDARSMHCFGQVSIQKDLDAKTCKHILNTIKCRSSCLCSGIDDNGDIKYYKDINSCSSYINPSDFKQGECIE